MILALDIVDRIDLHVLQRPLAAFPLRHGGGDELFDIPLVGSGIELVDLVELAAQFVPDAAVQGLIEFDGIDDVPEAPLQFLRLAGDFAR